MQSTTTFEPRKIQDILFTQLCQKNSENAHKSRKQLELLRPHGIDPFELQFSDRWLQI